MIRFHEVEISPAPWMRPRLLVTSYRKPRGYVIQDKETREERKLSTYEASLNYYVVHGWRGVGFNEQVTPLYPTRREAALAVLTHRRLQTEKTFTGTVKVKTRPYQRPSLLERFLRLFR